MGKLAGKDLIPDHELALSVIINKDRFLQTELTKEQAIQYLRRDNIIDLDMNTTGWSLMNFEGHALGWAKLLPNRINNYYPKEIRILSPLPPKGGIEQQDNLVYYINNSPLGVGGINIDLSTTKPAYRHIPSQSPFLWPCGAVLNFRCRG